MRQNICSATDGSSMTAIFGWTIIILGLGLFSLALLWPVFRLLRRRRPDADSLIWGYAAAAAGCSVVLWHLIPWAVHGLFGHKSP
jgi:hypothetical protein